MDRRDGIVMTRKPRSSGRPMPIEENEGIFTGFTYSRVTNDYQMMLLIGYFNEFPDNIFSTLMAWKCGLFGTPVDMSAVNTEVTKHTWKFRVLELNSKVSEKFNFRANAVCV